LKLNRVCHVVPAVPPIFNGVGDYAYRLWEYWPDPKPEWHVATMRMTPESQSLWQDATIHRYSSDPSSLSACLTDLDADLVVLHYVPHGYNNRGVPTWLPKELKQWKGKSGKAIFIVFHELYATGPFGTFRRLLAPWARKLLRDLARLSDGWSTSNQPFFDGVLNIGRVSKDRGLLLPVGPNIVPRKNPQFVSWHSIMDTPLQIVAFGSPGSRISALHTHSKLLTKLLAEERIGRLLLLGSEPSGGPSEESLNLISELGLAEHVDHQYNVTVEEASGALARSHIALIPTRKDILGKSGVYSSCAAHGLRCVLPGDAVIDEAFWDRKQIHMSWPEICSTISDRIIAIG
jgi:hypothetical protein